MGDALVPHHHGDLRHDARRQGEFPALFVEGVRQRRAAELAHLFVKVRLREAFGGASSYELERQRRARHPPRICVRRHDGFEPGGARPARGHVAAAPRLVGAAGQTERARALAAEDLGHFRQCHARFVGAAVDTRELGLCGYTRARFYSSLTFLVTIGILHINDNLGGRITKLPRLNRP